MYGVITDDCILAKIKMCELQNFAEKYNKQRPKRKEVDTKKKLVGELGAFRIHAQYTPT